MVFGFQVAQFYLVCGQMSATLGAIGYIAMSFAANDLFIATGPSVMRRQLWVIMAVLAVGIMLQEAHVAAWYFGWTEVLPVLDLLAAVCLAALPLSFWPVVRRLKQKQLRVVNRRLAQRVQRAEAACVAARNWLALAEQSGHVGHWQLSVPGNRLIWSDEVYRIHGLWRAHYKPRYGSFLALFNPEDGKRLAVLLETSAMKDGRFEMACRLRRPDGEIRHVIMRGAAQLDGLGKVVSLDGVMVDVTETRRAEAILVPHTTLSEPPLEDALTGLADRQQFDLSLGYEFKRAVRSRKPLGMVLLNIDHFNALRKHYGKHESDASLLQVAQAIQAIPRRTGDVVARYSEDEIAVLLPLADSAGALRVAGAMAEAVRALGLPNAGYKGKLLTVSCGAAAFVSMDDLYNPLELTRRANRALADAKAAGGNYVCAYYATEMLDALA